MKTPLLKEDFNANENKIHQEGKFLSLRSY
jgi:hypothetical protein